MAELGTVASPTQSERADDAVPLSAWYTLFVLLLMYTLQFMDRQIVAVLLEPIRGEFDLTDTQLGILTGFALSVPFAMAGIPLGIVADRVDRRKLIATLLMIWSACTVLCGVARNFPMLLAARAAVGASEAGGYPAAMAMIGDCFPERRRSLAASIFQCGASLGIMAAYLLGGYVATKWGWRMAFYVAFAPAPIVALMLLLTVRSPERRDVPAIAPNPAGRSFVGEFVEAITFIRRQPGLIHLMVGMVVAAFGLAAYASWTASFYVRTHDLPLSLVGTIAGSIAVFGAVSHIATSYVADRLGVTNARWPLYFAALCSVLVVPACLVMCFQPTVTGAVIGAVANAFVAGASLPICYAAILNVTPPGMRARIVSIIIVLTNVLGYGLGPLVTGMISDAFGGAVNVALAIVSTYGIWSAAHFVWAARGLSQQPGIEARAV